MWRLTVESITEKVIFDKPEEVKDEMVYETDSLHDVHSLINFTNKYGIGKFKYNIEYFTKEGECECTSQTRNI